MNEPLLSICIPTYNRAIFLKRMFDSIFTELDKEAINRLEICISDNASTDNTGKVVSDLMTKYPNNVTYERNDKNYGLAYNVFEVLKMAKGEFLLCIGDDDVFMGGAITYLLRIIAQIKKNAEIKIVFTKFSSNPGKKFVFKAFKKLQSEKMYHIREIEAYFIKDKLWSNGFLGAQIFHRDIMRGYFDDLAGQDNCNIWPHLSILLHSFKSLKKIFVSKPVICQTGDGLYWLRANWILALFNKVEVIDTALSREEITEYMAKRICSRILLSFVMLRLVIAAKIEDAVQFLAVVKRISAYKSSNSNMQLRINYFKTMLNVINLIPSLPLEVVYSFYVKGLNLRDIRMKKNGSMFRLGNKREGISINEQ